MHLKNSFTKRSIQPFYRVLIPWVAAELQAFSADFGQERAYTPSWSPANVSASQSMPLKEIYYTFFSLQFKTTPRSFKNMSVACFHQNTIGLFWSRLMKWASRHPASILLGQWQVMKTDNRWLGGIFWDGWPLSTFLGIESWWWTLQAEAWSFESGVLAEGDT